MTKRQAIKAINEHIKMQKELGSSRGLIWHSRWCQIKILFSIPRNTELRRMEKEVRRHKR